MNSTTTSFELLSDEVRRIAESFGLGRETPIQAQAIPKILGGENVLVISPTGSGKTEAALLPILHKIREAKDKQARGIQAIYITPLRALNRDMLRRLEQWGEALGLSVLVRHGDTTQKERRSQALSPPDILITTPETLQAILIGSRMRANLSELQWIVVDEIHELASDRRGSQLALGLERLCALTKEEPQRIGLSATVSNSEEISEFLCGSGRKCTIVDASSTIEKAAEYRVELPEPTPEDDLKSREIYTTPQMMARLQRILDLIGAHDSTLIFVNSRTNAEMLSSRFAMLGVRVGVHHGSLPREERERVEQEFKEGKLRALICTSTLELGIDIGSVDLVIQYMSPRQVNALIQRVGRSGHSLGRRSEGVILSVSPEDALESLALSNEALEKRLEPVYVHDCPLDVLCHQIAGLLLDRSAERLSVRDILSTCRKAFPFKKLSEEKLTSVLSYMEKLGYLRVGGDSLVTRRRKCREYYVMNLSMIPDERRYQVIDVSTEGRVGILGEEFVALHAKVGVHFIIKGRVWQIESLSEGNVYVTPVVDPTAAIPGWDGELLPIPETVARSVGAERRRIEETLPSAGDKESLSRVLEESKRSWNAERSARERIILEAVRQKTESATPTDQRIVVEKFGRYLVIHTSSGDRINTTLGEFFEEILLRDGMIRHWWNDGYRILIELVTEEFDCREIASKLFFYGSGTEGYLNSVIRKHFPFGYYMKFIAERFGALERGRMLSEEALKELVVKFRFTPIYEETLREALATKVDAAGAIQLLSDCSTGRRELRITTSTDHASPLAMYILSRYAELEDGGGHADSVESMRASAMNEVVSLLCFKCAALQEHVRIGNIPDEPACPECGSKLVAVLFYGARFVKTCLDKKKKNESLSDQEADALSKARRSADLVLSYGKKGVIAQSVYGVGPQTAYKLLSRMHETDEAFYKDLIEAKIKFIETKPYWD